MGDIELARIASRQDALVTRWQALGHLSRKQLQSRLESGRLLPYRWGVYVFPGSPASATRHLRAACLAAGPGAVASHQAAAVLWDIRGVWCEHPEVTVPYPSWPRLAGVKSHQSTRLDGLHVASVDGIAATSVARTICDMAATFDARFLGRLTDGCARRGILDLDDLRLVSQQVARRGRRHTAAVRQVLAERLPGYDPCQSGGELDLFRVLVDAGFPAPERQYQVVVNGTVYVLDFAYLDGRIDIEYDSWDYHATRSGFEHDTARDNALRLAGWTVLRYTSGSRKSRIVADVAAARDRSLRDFAPVEV